MNAAWGETFGAITNGLLNAGDNNLSGVKISTDGWKDSDGALVANARSLVANARSLVANARSLVANGAGTFSDLLLSMLME